jgi:SPP1 gp7 family putative phage head morphogenesis protein
MSTAWALLIESERILQRIDAARKQTDWEGRAERRLTNMLAELLAEVGIDAVQELRRMGFVPSDDASRKRIAEHLQARLQPFADILTGGATEAAQHGRNAIISELQRQGVGLQFTAFSDDMSRLIREGVFEASERTLQRMTGDVMSNLAQSYEDGLGIDDAARRLDDVFDDLRTHESERIARTEIQSRQNEGAHRTIEEFGVQYEQWLAADDDRTRESHAEINGVIVRTGDLFPLGPGVQYPGDFSSGADLSELINCRCRVRPIIPPRGAVPPPGRDWWYESEWVQV